MAFKSPLEQAQTLILANPTDQNAQAPIIQAKPQRFTRRPTLEDYGLKPNEGAYKEFKNAYYYSEPDDIDKEISALKEKVANPKDNWDSDFYSKKLNALSNPELQRYLKDRNAYNSQFEKDYNEYYPTAKAAVIKKLLGDGDLFRKKMSSEDDYYETDDIGDSINAEFAKKYGYEDIWDGELFSPLRKHGGSYSALGKEERDPNLVNGYRTSRAPYNKTAYIGELLRNGELTLDELKQYILGGK